MTSSFLESIGVLAIIVSGVLAVFGLVRFGAMIAELLDDISDLQSKVKGLEQAVVGLEPNTQKKVGVNIS